MKEVNDTQRQDEQDASHVLSTDDELARRLLSLVLAFSNASAPLSSAYVQKEYYPTLTAESFRRQFHRDRERLLTCGLLLHEAKKGWWVADETSFATEVSLEPGELLALDLTLSQLANDPTFPYSDDLRYALAKIDSDYSKVSAARFLLLPPSKTGSSIYFCMLQLNIIQFRCNIYQLWVKKVNDFLLFMANLACGVISTL